MDIRKEMQIAIYSFSTKTAGIVFFPLLLGVTLLNFPPVVLHIKKTHYVYIKKHCSLSKTFSSKLL